MDAIRVAKVDRVLYSKPGLRAEGTLHLTAHHLIFKYGGDGSALQEIWVPYPLISTVARMPLSLHGQSPLAIRTRTFEYFTLTFTRDRDAIDVFESVKELTVASSVTSLYAFFYEPSPPYDTNDGWSLYSPRDEFARMGLGSRTKAWRFTDVNKDYTICPTYPARMVVPAKISDSTLTYGSKYRSKGRIPALVYLHWNNQASITRSSQPTVGLTNSRSIQDEKLIEAIFQSHHLSASPYASIPSNAANSTVYGATATNIIIDARSATSGVANVARGGGTENMDYYKEGRKVYLGIENIHVMRDSLKMVADALRDADSLLTLLPAGSSSSVTDSPPGGATTNSLLDRQALRRSGWLKHLSALLDGALIIVKNVHVNASHVLIHCSDGWDRTAQLSTLAQLCLDPYYRTYRGFQVLVEKDWVSFGHRFLDRCGHLSSEKFFLSTSSQSADGAGGDGGGGGQGAQAFFASVQNKFTSPSHLKETSPVFHQFLECVRQIQRQHPARFEFNERFLERLHYHLYSCQYGTFMFNNERERRVPSGNQTKAAWQRTNSVWDELNSEQERTKYINPLFDPSLDARDTPGGDQGVLFPDPRNVKFWHELYGRTDEEMNGRIPAVTAAVQGGAKGVDVIGPIENAQEDPAQPSTPSRIALALSEDIDATAAQIAPHPHPAEQSQTGSSSFGLGATNDDVALSAPAPLHGRLSSPPANSGGVGLLPSSAPSSQAAALHPQIPNHHDPNAAGTSTWASLSPPRPSSSSSSRPASPGRRVAPSRDSAAGSSGGGLFPTVAAGGVKSFWGSLSSNASAAFSVVQEAYDKNAKDFVSQYVGAPGGQQGNGRERELVANTGTGANAGARWRASSPSPAPALDDPWSTPSGSSRQLQHQQQQPIASSGSTRGYSLPSHLDDDPWSTPAPSSSSRQSPLVTSATLPAISSSSAQQRSPGPSSRRLPESRPDPDIFGQSPWGASAPATSSSPAIRTPTSSRSTTALSDPIPSSPTTPPHPAPIPTSASVIPLPSQNPYITVRAPPSPSRSSSLEPPSHPALLRQSSVSSLSSSLDPLTLHERDPALSPRPSPSPRMGAGSRQGSPAPSTARAVPVLAVGKDEGEKPKGSEDAAAFDPLGVGILG